MLMFKNGARYNSIGPFLKEKFGGRVMKAAIDAGFTCPNRDGSRGYGGCIYCSEEGSGEFAGLIAEGISPDGRITVPVKQEDRRFAAAPTDQISSQLAFIQHKWKDPLCIAYFQNFTNTYAPVPVLEKLYRNALTHPRCRGLAIATRPDCIGDDVLDLLDELNRETFLWVELGLQTSDDNTAKFINRCCSMADYDNAVSRLESRGIRTVTHLMFGLPGEDRETMLRSVSDVCRHDIFGIKLHMLNVLRGTALGAIYEKEPFHMMTMDEYISLVCDALEIIPRKVTIHRLTGDPPPDLLIAPEWTLYKRNVLNGINRELKRRGTVQGCRAAAPK